jgi:hypothetical protein
MKKFNKLIALAAAVAVTSLPFSLSAQGSNYAYGNGYQEYRTAPNTAAAWVFGGVALAAIIAVAVQNSQNNHNHSHCGG